MVLSIVNCQLSIMLAQDLQILSHTDLVGSARYVGLAGAMTAVGGDPSAVKDNPAGLGVFRRLDIALTLDMDFDRVYQDKQRVGLYNTFTSTQASVVFSMMNPDRSSVLRYNNVMFSYHRLASFNRQYTVGQTANWSLADVICLMTNGLPESALQPSERWSNQDVGWLSCQGYDTYLISPTPEDTLMWQNVLEEGQTVKNNFSIKETGYVNQFSLAWGGNFFDRLYVGVSMNVLSLYHNQSVQYFEEFGEGCGLDNNTYVAHSGLGFNASVGVIYHPIQWLRVGASFTTPSAMALTTTTYGDLASTLWYVNPETGASELKGITSSSPDNRYTDRSTTMPLRFSLGAAFQCMNYGLISVQYDLSHNKHINNVHALRVGLEGVISNHFFLNAGYAFEGTFKQSAPVELASIRTDAYTESLNSTQYVTAGFGYRASHFMVHAAYRFRMQRIDTYAHQLTDPYQLNAMTHGIVITLGFHTK